MSARSLPRSYPEILSDLNRVGSQKTGPRSANFTLVELRQIARNLGLDSTGSKDVLASRILAAARSYGPRTRRLPQNYPEMLNELHLVRGERSGRGSDDFTVTDLKQIARNLGLTQTGNKQEVANRILSAVLTQYGVV